MAGLAEVEAVLKGFWTLKNWRSWRRKGRWSVLAPLRKYSPGLRIKKKTIQSRYLIARLRFPPPLIGGINGLEDVDGDWEDC